MPSAHAHRHQLPKSFRPACSGLSLPLAPMPLLAQALTLHPEEVETARDETQEPLNFKRALPCVRFAKQPGLGTQVPRCRRAVAVRWLGLACFSDSNSRGGGPSTPRGLCAYCPSGTSACTLPLGLLLPLFRCGRLCPCAAACRRTVRFLLNLPGVLRWAWSYHGSVGP